MKHFIAVALAASLVATSASKVAVSGQDGFGPYNLQSGKVHAVGTGKTARREQWYEVPAGHYFVEDSWKIHPISGSGKNAGCGFLGFEKTEIPVTLPNGTSVTILEVTKFGVYAHAETGSNTGGRTAWAECEVSAVTAEYD